MIQQYTHQTQLGFMLWADNFLCNRGQAFTTVTTKLYYTPDAQLPSNCVAYSSPFKSWVYDSGVAGAYIPNSISGSLGVLTTGAKGLVIDYENGRVILNSSVGTTAQLTGTYSFKDFNIYPTNDSWENIIMDNKPYLNSRFGRPMSGIQPYDYVTPCILINPSDGTNNPLAFGGLQDTITNISMIVLAETDWQLEGALSIFRDAAYRCFPKVDQTVDPINESGGLKSGFNWTLISTNAAQNDYVYINSVKTSKYNETRKASDALYIGFAEFKLSSARTP